jgi:hypothetical protein
VSQSVKEVLQSLVDDELVQYDKIGASNCQLSMRICTMASFDLYSWANQSSGAFRHSEELSFVAQTVFDLTERC